MKTKALKVGVMLFSAFIVVCTATADLSAGPGSRTNSADLKSSEKELPTPEDLRKVPPVVVPEGRPKKAGAPESETTLLNGGDHELLMSAFENSQVIEWLSSTARTKARDNRLRALGDVFLADQKEEEEELRKLAKHQGVNLKTEEAAVQQRKLASEVRKSGGQNVDDELVERLVEAASNGVEIYEKGLRSKDPNLREFCSRMLPEAKKNLSQAQSFSYRWRFPTD